MLQDLHTRTSYEHHRRTSIQAPLKQNIFKIFMQGLATGFNLDLHKIFSHQITRTSTITRY